MLAIMRGAIAALLLLVGAAVAHGTSYSDLGGRTLCLDDRSVEVQVGADDAPNAAAYATEVAATLAAALRSTLDRYQIPYRERTRCRALFTRVDFLLRRSVDGRGRPFHWVQAGLQVGRAPRRGPLPADGTLEDIRFNALYTNAHFPPGEDAAFFAGLPANAGELIDDLAVAWWDDLERRPATPGWLPYGGGALALATALAALLLTRRYRWVRRGER